jgi:hypothetical protein
MKGVDADAAAATDREQYTHTLARLQHPILWGNLFLGCKSILSPLSLFLLASALHLAVPEYYLDIHEKNNCKVSNQET